MGVARDNYGRDGTSKSYVAGFAEVEVDTETGKYQVLDFLAVADVGTVIHPRTCEARPWVASCWGWDMHSARSGCTTSITVCRWPSVSTTTSRPPSSMRRTRCSGPRWTYRTGNAGRRARSGEAPVGAGCCAVMNALIDALGEDVFRRAPITADMILTALEAGRPTHAPLAANV